jgi:3',5'-cyclic AMP phosphodiesterase CpdA
MKENMSWRKYIPALLYVLLLFGCLIVVVLVGKFAGHKGEEETSAFREETSSKALEQEEESSEEQTETEWDREEVSSEEDISLDQGKDAWSGGRDMDSEALPEDGTEEEPYVPPAVMLVSDLHYISPNTHDDGAAFWKMVSEDDGKISQYSQSLIDTLTEEAIKNRPSALVLTGDITLNGEKKNHLELAEGLRRVTGEGILVLVIPGNHDIKNKNAAEYFGDQRTETEYLETAQDFEEIYHEFGYDQAFSRDVHSLSYVVALDDFHWMMMLDTCQYEDRNHVDGRLKDETLIWMEDVLVQAKEQGIQVLPVGHHNLLSESRLYIIECTMKNHQEIIQVFEKYELPLYISGHLHAQRIKKHKAEPGVDDDAYGVSEIVLPPYSIPPCQYGQVKWGEDGSMIFDTRKADVEAWARGQGCEDINLLQFDKYGAEFMKGVIEEQVKKTFGTIPENLKDEMAALYSELYFDYCAGNRMNWDHVRTTKAYRLWERLAPDNRYVKNMSQMIEDVKQDLHDWKWTKGDLPGHKGRQ